MKIIKLILILLLFTNFTLSNQSSKKYIVVLDPGHGGSDNGTYTKNQINEKEINLFVAKYVELHLKEFAPNIEIILTRENDTLIPLKNRPLYAKFSNADLFISIHCNHNKKTYAKGLEIYIQKKPKITAKNNFKKAHLYAYLLNQIITEKLKYKSRGIKYENFSVLRNTIDFVPSVLIELGFFSNQNDANYITSKKGMDGMALAISKSIIDYFE